MDKTLLNIALKDKKDLILRLTSPLLLMNLRTTTKTLTESTSITWNQQLEKGETQIITKWSMITSKRQDTRKRKSKERWKTKDKRSCRIFRRKLLISRMRCLLVMKVKVPHVTLLCHQRDLRMIWFSKTSNQSLHSSKEVLRTSRIHNSTWTRC